MCYNVFELNIAKCLIITTIVLLIVPVAGCGKSNELRELTNKAIMAAGEAHCYRMSTVLTSTTDGKTSKNTFALDFVAPDRYRQRSGCPSCGDDSWQEMIFIGDKGYFRSSDRPQWCQLPCEGDDPSTGASGGVQATPRDHLADVLEPLNWLVDLEELPSEEVNGFACWHYLGRVDMDSYIKKTAKTEEGQAPSEVAALYEGMRRGTRIVEVWVEKGSYLIQQMKSRECYTVVNVTTGEVNSFSGVMTIQFYDFNKPVTIEPPEID